MDSILISTKAFIGITEEDETYDNIIIMDINDAFSTLTQLGVGPIDGYSVESKEDLWSSYLITPYKLAIVKTYVLTKTKLSFDPPSNSSLLAVLENKKKEAEWRLFIKEEGDIS